MIESLMTFSANNTNNIQYDRLYKYITYTIIFEVKGSVGELKFQNFAIIKKLMYQLFDDKSTFCLN